MSPLTILAIYAVTFSNEPDVDHITNLTNTPIEFNDGQTYADEHQWEEELELKSLKKPVRKFLQANPNIEEFTESCSSIDECHDYYFLSKDYELDFAPEDVFKNSCIY